MRSNVEDIELARSLLEEEKWNLVIVKGGQVLFTSRERGIAPFFQVVQSIGRNLHNAVVADRIVGLAVAMLCLHARIASVYGSIASQGALDMLKKKGVAVSSQNIVPHISNYDGTDLCPFEKLAGSCQRPSQLLAALQSLFAKGDQ
jgi:phosphatidylglycerophosphatase A